jgi:hypothetical protein
MKENSCFLGGCRAVRIIQRTAKVISLRGKRERKRGEKETNHRAGGRTGGLRRNYDIALQLTGTNTEWEGGAQGPYVKGRRAASHREEKGGQVREKGRKKTGYLRVAASSVALMNINDSTSASTGSFAVEPNAGGPLREAVAAETVAATAR